MAEPQQVLVAPQHPLATARHVTLRQLLDYPVVAPAMHGGSRTVFDAAWAAEGLSIRPAVETNSMHVVASALMAGRAVAIMSARRAQAYVAAGHLVSLSTTSDLLAQGRADLLVRRGERLPPAAEALARAMARTFNSNA
jgi:LysR family transcriptional regulator of gallate degradation